MIKYVAFRTDSSSVNLLAEMKSYVEQRVYDTLFGDALPLMLANALKMNIIVIIAENSEFYCRVIECESNVTVCIENSIFVYKMNDHYDTIIPIPPEACTIALCNELPMAYADKACVDKTTNFKERAVNDIKHIGPSSLSHDHNHDSNGREIKFCSWNIWGVTSYKLHDDILGGFLKQYDIVLLTETWTKNNDNLCLENYVFYNFAHNALHPNAKRNSGGIGIFFIKRDIIKGVEIRKHTDDIISWIKLKRTYFGLVNDLYIGNVYMVPDSSNHVRHDAFELLQNDIAEKPMGAEILICGDYNAHTNIKRDYHNYDWRTGNDEIDDIVNNTNNERLRLINCMYEDNHLDRFSEDMRPVNNNGRLLLDICKIPGLVIVNGRLGDDKGICRATRIMGEQSSVVDYVIATPKLFDQITHFEIHDKLPESDHLPVIFMIKCSGTRPGQDHVVASDWKPKKIYCCSTPDLDNFKTILNDDISNIYFTNINDALLELKDTYQIATAVNELITQVTDRAIRFTRGTRRSRGMAPRWYDAECRRLRSLAVKAGERLTSDDDRANLTVICKQYKSCKQKKKRSHRNDNIRMIEQSSNSTDFWKVLNNICPSSKPANQPTGTEFVEYFK